MDYFQALPALIPTTSHEKLTVFLPALTLQTSITFKPIVGSITWQRYMDARTQSILEASSA